MMNDPGSKDFWEKNAGNFKNLGEKITSPYIEKAINLSNPNPDLLITDIACGTGNLAAELAKTGAKVYANDFSAPMIEMTKEKTKDFPNVQTEIMDGQSLIYEDDTFDLAFSLFGIVLFPDLTKGLSEMFRVLKPGGVGVISSWLNEYGAEILQIVSESIKHFDPEMESRTTEGLKNMSSLASAENYLTEVGFKHIQLHEISSEISFKNLDEAVDTLMNQSQGVIKEKNIDSALFSEQLTKNLTPNLNKSGEVNIMNHGVIILMEKV